jgi:hypothetical protein
MTCHSQRDELDQMPAELSPCGCCQGLAVRTRQAIVNRPGLSQLRFRRGTHRTFLESLLARISSYGLEERGLSEEGSRGPVGMETRLWPDAPSDDALARLGKSGATRLLRDMLTTRETSDPAIALFDAWSTIADVLSFYQERLANEGFLRTATEQRSLYELSRLVGYRPRNGLSSSVYLAFEVDDAALRPLSTGIGQPAAPTPSASAAQSQPPSLDVPIPAGTKAKSTPNAGSTDESQTFETSFPLIARREWNEMRPRRTRPADLRFESLPAIERLSFSGIGLRLAQNDPIVIEPDSTNPLDVRRVLRVREDQENSRTDVEISRHPLSLQQLVDELSTLLTNFLSPIRSVPAQAYVADVETAFQQLSKKPDEQTLSSVISAVELAKRDIQGSTYRTRAEHLGQWATALLAKATDENGPFKDGLARYRAAVSEVIDVAKARLDFLRSFAATLSTTMSLRDALVEAKLALANEKLLQPHLERPALPNISIALPPTSSLQTSGLFSIPAIARILPAHLNEQVRAKFGAVAFTGSTPLPPKVTKTEQLSQESTELSADASFGEGTWFVHVRLRNLSNEHLGSSLARLTVGSGADPFNGQITEKTRLQPSPASTADSVPLDRLLEIPDIQSFGSGPYWARIEFLDGQSPDIESFEATDTSYELGSPIDSPFDAISQNTYDLKPSLGAQPTWQRLRDALRTLKVKVPQGKAYATQLITLFNGDPNTTSAPKAAVLLDLRLYEETRSGRNSNNAAPALLARLAQLHAELEQSASPLGNIIQNFATELGNTGQIDAAKASLDGVASVIQSTVLSGAIEQSVLARASLTPPATVLLRDHSTNVVAELNRADDLFVQSMIDRLGGGSGSLRAALQEAATSFEHSSQVYADQPNIISWRTEQLPRELSAREVQARRSPNLQAIVIYEGSVKWLVSVIQSLEKTFTQLQAATGAFGVAVDEAVSRRRRVLLSKLKAASDESQSVLNQTVDAWPAIQSVVTAFEGPGRFTDANCLLLTSLEMPNACTASANPLRPMLQTINDAQQTALQRLIDKWTRVARLANQTPATDQVGSNITGDIESAIERIRELLRLGVSQTGSISEVASFLAYNPSLVPQIIGSLAPSERQLLFTALTLLRGGAPHPPPKVWAFRSRAKLFGWNALVPMLFRPRKPPHEAAGDESDLRLFLDGSYSQTLPKTPILIVCPEGVIEPHRVEQSLIKPRSEYFLSGDATRVDLKAADGPWWQKQFHLLRNTSAWCDAVELPLAEPPEPDKLPAGPDISRVLLDGPNFELSIGRTVILEGRPYVGEQVAETPVRQRCEVREIQHLINPDIYGDRFCTQLTINPPLVHQFLRSSVRIYANVVSATHGESQHEIVGGGEAGKAFQSFPLKRPELTQLPAPTPSGVEAQLKVWVNDVQWRDVESFRDSQTDSEHFIKLSDDEQRTTVVFGDGAQGSRLPSGLENVRASYRSGLGSKGNVAAMQIDQVVGAPLGVKKVVNPLSAQGGADPDSIEELRDRAPLAVTAMDRLVSVRDYADFCRSYAGIGKASATRLRGAIHITVAALDATPFDMSGPIVQNLRQALRLFADPSQRFVIHDRNAALLILAATVRIDPSHEWQKIEPQLRSALLKEFSYQRADLGKDLLLSDAIEAFHRIDGVQYVDVEKFDKVEGRESRDLQAQLSALERRPRIHVSARDVHGVAELCYLPPDIPSALILEYLQ